MTKKIKKVINRLLDFKIIAVCAVGIVASTVTIETRFQKAQAFQGYKATQVQEREADKATAAKERLDDKIERLERDKLFLLRPYQGNIDKATPYDKAIYDQIQLDLNRLYRKQGG